MSSFCGVHSLILNFSWEFRIPSLGLFELVFTAIFACRRLFNDDFSAPALKVGDEASFDPVAPAPPRLPVLEITDLLVQDAFEF